MPITFTSLEFGQSYERKYLAKIWGYKSQKAIERGVITPAGTGVVVLFVTKIKAGGTTQYDDYIDGDLLFWEGETAHGTDERIVNARREGNQIHLFYRDIHHTPFTYFGRVTLIEHELKGNRPSRFVYNIESLDAELEAVKELREHEAEYRALPETERDAIVKSRVGQGLFRRDLIKLWGSCALTNLEDVTLLRASHLKPWKDSSNAERLSAFNGLLLIPNYDFLLDKGLITFRSNGHIVVSKRLGHDVQSVFHVDKGLSLRSVFPQNRAFLEYHRDAVFR